MKIAVTGHRPDKLNNDYGLDGPVSILIKNHLQRCITQLEPTQMISGMALGVDTIWALLAIENNIPLLAALPCLNQESRWTKTSIELYQSIINNPLTTSVYVTEEPYNTACMQRRNIYMVDNCDVLLAVWDRSSGGTSNCIKYADSINKKKLVLYLK